MNKKNIFGTISLIAVGVVFGVMLVTSFGWVRPSIADVKIGQDSEPVTNFSQDAVSFNNAFINTAEKVKPSMVEIAVVATREIPHNGLQFKFPFPFNDNKSFESQGEGSGVIISKDGYILTNNHVVKDAKAVTVGLVDKRKFEETVCGTDPLTDLAVIKIDAENLTPAFLGNSDEEKVGQWVMAIGNPLSLSSTVTAGIVSAKGRNLRLIQDSYGVEDFIQTDAVINPGNSGGALVGLNGALIGINTAIATDGMTSRYIGYGFAIPINLAKAVSKDLIAFGKVNRGYIGVQIEGVDASTAKAVGLDRPHGVLVQSIVKDGAAESADIKAGDIILKIDDKDIDQPNELQAYVASKSAGTEVKLTLFRDGSKIESYVTLKARDNGKSIEPVVNNESKDNGIDREMEQKEYDDLGLTVKNMKSSELREFNIEHGVMIVKVKRFSKAFNQSLVEGTVITEVNKKPIDSVSEFDDAIDSNRGNSVLIRYVGKEGFSRFVGLDIPE